MGGTAQEGDWNLEVSDVDGKAIVDRAIKYMPNLKVSLELSLII